jgi:hypothetical protein
MKTTNSLVFATQAAIMSGFTDVVKKVVNISIFDYL